MPSPTHARRRTATSSRLNTKPYARDSSSSKSGTDSSDSSSNSLSPDLSLMYPADHPLIDTPRQEHARPLAPPADIPGFPTYDQYKRIETTYLTGLSERKQSKALISQDLFDQIWDVLHGIDKFAGTAQFRFWVRKMFALSYPQTEFSGAHDDPLRQVVVHDSRPIAVKEQLYDILCYCHTKAGHGGRDKTCAAIRELYSWVPKELTAQFVKSCPTCTLKRSGNPELVALMKEQTMASFVKREPESPQPSEDYALSPFYGSGPHDPAPTTTASTMPSSSPDEASVSFASRLCSPEMVTSYSSRVVFSRPSALAPPAGPVGPPVMPTGGTPMVRENATSGSPTSDSDSGLPSPYLLYLPSATNGSLVRHGQQFVNRDWQGGSNDTSDYSPDPDSGSEVSPYLPPSLERLPELPVPVREHPCDGGVPYGWDYSADVRRRFVLSVAGKLDHEGPSHPRMPRATLGEGHSTDDILAQVREREHQRATPSPPLPPVKKAVSFGDNRAAQPLMSMGISRRAFNQIRETDIDPQLLLSHLAVTPAQLRADADTARAREEAVDCSKQQAAAKQPSKDAGAGTPSLRPAYYDSTASLHPTSLSRSGSGAGFGSRIRRAGAPTRLVLKPDLVAFRSDATDSPGYLEHARSHQPTPTSALTFASSSRSGEPSPLTPAYAHAAGTAADDAALARRADEMWVSGNRDPEGWGAWLNADQYEDPVQKSGVADVEMEERDITEAR